MFRILAGAALIFGGLLIGGCSSDSDDDPVVAVSAYDAIGNNPDLSTLKTAIDAAGLEAALSDPDSPLTIFAPNNAAFDALDAGTLPTLLADPQGQLTSILQHHVVGGGATDAAAATAAIADGPVELTTLNGTTITLDSTDTGISIGGANVVQADSGGYVAGTSVSVVHVIDAVLLP